MAKDEDLDAQSARKSRENGRKTRQRLLATAVALWSELGQLGVTISAVAERARTSRRTVYHHFPSREVLVAEAEKFVESELASLAGGRSVSNIADPYRFVADLAADSPELIRSIMSKILSEPPQQNSIVAEATQNWSGSLRNKLKPGVEPKDIAAISIAMWCAAVLIVSSFSKQPERRAEARRFAQIYRQLLVEGILTEPAEAEQEPV